MNPTLQQQFDAELEKVVELNNAAKGNGQPASSMKDLHESIAAHCRQMQEIQRVMGITGE